MERRRMGTGCFERPALQGRMTPWHQQGWPLALANPQPHQ